MKTVSIGGKKVRIDDETADLLEGEDQEVAYQVALKLYRKIFEREPPSGMPL